MIDNGFFTDQIARSLLLGLLGFLLAMTITPIYSYFAYRYGFWKKKRTTDSSGKELKVMKKLSTRKRRVPTMAGVIMLVSAALITLLFNLSREQTWLPLAALAGGGIVGLIDDIINVRGDGTGVAGLRAPIKFFMIATVASAAAWFFYYKLGYTSVHVAFVGDVNLGVLIIPLFVLAVVSTGNAVNISDGLDGLAGGLLLTAYGAFGLIALLQGNYGIAGFCFTICGTLISYMWFNIPPARFFMGDIGSFSLGTSLGVVAMLTDTLLLLPIIGFVFVVEAGSSMLQIMSKKYRGGKKIFLVAPIHYHFEAGGWPRTKVTMRFWLVGLFFAVIGVIIAVSGGY